VSSRRPVPPASAAWPARGCAPLCPFCQADPAESPLSEFRTCRQAADQAANRDDSSPSRQSEPTLSARPGIDISHQAEEGFALAFDVRVDEPPTAAVKLTMVRLVAGDDGPTVCPQ
jgi:hypothetical protein